MPRIGIDIENNSVAWWEAAASATVPDCLASLIFGDAEDLTLTTEELAEALAWAETLPGWNDGPEHAPHPLVWQKAAQ